MTSSIPTSAIIIRSPDPLSAAVDGEVVLMVTSRDCYVGLNPIASVIWDRLSAPVKVSDLIAALQDDFDGAPERIAADVMALLAEMAQLDLLTVVEAPAS